VIKWRKVDEKISLSVVVDFDSPDWWLLLVGGMNNGEMAREFVLMIAESNEIKLLALFSPSTPHTAPDRRVLVREEREREERE